jgi:putative FmdB family regulatory protein
MPTYEYRCPSCGHRFELFQRMSDTPGAPCPSCGAAAERLLSAGAGFLFKGDGFYITDYRSADYKKKAESEGGSAPAPAASPAPAAAPPPSSGTGAGSSSGGTSSPSGQG